MTESTPILELDNVSYAYTKGGKKVLKNISRSFMPGKVYSITGPSGAGKTTMLSLICGLAGPTEGRVMYNGGDLAKQDRYGYRSHDIGVIFQSFNLLPSLTVAENIVLSMDASGKAFGMPKKERAVQLLKEVHLPAEYANERILHLSGGEQQRVAIARALANNPDILLSDEATSALDPNTTKSILKLLRQLHDTLGLTIVIITHQMSVVKQICNKVAVIDHGTIVEEGRLFDIFVNPQAPLTKSFVATTSNLDKVNDLIEEHSPLVSVGDGGVLLRMRYISKEVSEALVSHISRQFDIDVNIVFGDIDVVEGSPLGGLVVVITGDRNNILAAIDYLKNRNIGIEVLAS